MICAFDRVLRRK